MREFLSKINGTKLPKAYPTGAMPPAVKPSGAADVDFELSIPSVGAVKTKVTKETSNDIAKVVAGAAIAILCFIFGFHTGKKHV
jgi:hypothetical protein